MTIEQLKELPEGEYVAFNSEVAAGVLRKEHVTAEGKDSERIWFHYTGITVAWTVQQTRARVMRTKDRSTSIPVQRMTARLYSVEDEDFQKAKRRIIHGMLKYPIHSIEGI